MGEWREFLTATDEDLDSEFLTWVGIEDIWFDRRLGYWYTVERDVIPCCRHVDLIGEDWDANFPGRNGTNYSLHTDDSAALRKEARNQVASLIRKSAPARRAVLAEEARKYRRNNRKTKPPNSLRLMSEKVWDDLCPTEYVYFVQRDKKAQRYQLWVYSHGIYENSTVSVPLDSTDIAVRLLRAYDASHDVSRSTEIPSDEAIRASTK